MGLITSAYSTSLKIVPKFLCNCLHDVLLLILLRKYISVVFFILCVACTPPEIQIHTTSERSTSLQNHIIISGVVSWSHEMIFGILQWDLATTMGESFGSCHPLEENLNAIRYIDVILKIKSVIYNILTYRWAEEQSCGSQFSYEDGEWKSRRVWKLNNIRVSN